MAEVLYGNQKKKIILSELTERGYGYNQIDEDGGVSNATFRLRFDTKNFTLIIKGESGLFAYPINNKCTLDLSGFGIASAVDCLVVNENNKAVLYGSTTANKYRCFNLADEYVKLQKSTKSPKVLSVDDKKCDVPEPSAETDNNIEISVAEEVEEQRFDEYCG